MDLSEEEIRSAIAGGEISAITLDTSIFDGNGNRFEHGLLAKLDQFNGTGVQVVLSDVVVGEIKVHVCRAAADALAKTKAALKEVGKTWQVSPERRDAATSSLFGEESPEQVAQRRIQAFIDAVNVQIVRSKGRVDVEALLESYFGSTPPFGTTLSKKSDLASISRTARS